MYLASGEVQRGECLFIDKGKKVTFVKTNAEKQITSEWPCFS